MATEMYSTSYHGDNDLSRLCFLVTGGAGSSVVWPFLVGANGQAAVELTTVGADGQAASSPLVALPSWAANPTSPPEVSAVGSDHGVVVLNVAHSLTHSTIGVDVATLSETADLAFQPGAVALLDDRLGAPRA